MIRNLEFKITRKHSFTQASYISGKVCTLSFPGNNSCRFLLILIIIIQYYLQWTKISVSERIPYVICFSFFYLSMTPALKKQWDMRMQFPRASIRVFISVKHFERVYFPFRPKSRKYKQWTAMQDYTRVSKTRHMIAFAMAAIKSWIANILAKMRILPVTFA